MPLFISQPARERSARPEDEDEDARAAGPYVLLARSRRVSDDEVAAASAAASDPLSVLAPPSDSEASNAATVASADVATDGSRDELPELLCADVLGPALLVPAPAKAAATSVSKKDETRRDEGRFTCGCCCGADSVGETIASPCVVEGAGENGDDGREGAAAVLVDAGEEDDEDDEDKEDETSAAAAAAIASGLSTVERLVCSAA